MFTVNFNYPKLNHGWIFSINAINERQKVHLRLPRTLP